MKRSREEQYEETLGDLIAYKNSAVQALADAQSSRDGLKVLYLTDFNIIHPYMWENLRGHSVGGIHNESFFDVVGRSIVSLEGVYKNTSEFTIEITDLSLIEIIDSIYHRYEHFSSKTRKRESADALFQEVNHYFKSFERNLRLNSDETLQALRKITARLPNGSFKDAGLRITQLIEHGVVHLLGRDVPEDLLREALKKGKMEHDLVFQRIKAAKYEKESRSIDHSSMHYSADAWHLVLPEQISQLSSDVSVKFVCKPALGKYTRDERKSDEYLRSPLAPFLKLTALHNSGYRGDIRNEADDWLREVYSQASLRVKRLKSVENLDQMSENSLMFINKFYNDYVRLAFSHKEIKVEMEKERDRIAGILQNRVSFLDHFDAAADDAKRGGRGILMERPQLRSPDLLQMYDLEENPHLRHVFKSLGL